MLPGWTPFSISLDKPLGFITTQERLWTETTADDPATEENAQQGGCIPMTYKQYYQD